LKAIIHIGTAKAGSTAIQRFLFRNRRLLKQAGYHIPFYKPTKQYGFHAYVITSIENIGWRRLNNQLDIHSQEDLEAFQAGFEAVAREDLDRASHSQSHMVLSVEGLSSKSIEEIERLRDLLTPSCSEFAVIVYLRRQDLKRISSLRAGIKNKGNTTQEVFQEEFQPNLDYFAKCERWASVFGEAAVFPRIFPDSALASYDLIDDFAQLSGIADTPVHAQLLRPGRRNQAWDWRAVEFIRLINDHLPALEDGKVSPARTRLERILKNRFPECEQRLPARADAISFYDTYRESNECLRAKWFPQQASLFNEDFSKYPEQVDDRELSVEDAVYIASCILREAPADNAEARELDESTPDI